MYTVHTHIICRISFFLFCLDKLQIASVGETMILSISSDLFVYFTKLIYCWLVLPLALTRTVEDRRSFVREQKLLFSTICGTFNIHFNAAVQLCNVHIIFNYVSWYYQHHYHHHYLTVTIRALALFLSLSLLLMKYSKKNPFCQSQSNYTS